MHNVIFDIGNVVVLWRPYNALSHLFSDENEMTEVLAKIGFYEWNVEQDRGRSWSDGLAHIEEALPEYFHIFQEYFNRLEAAHPKPVIGVSRIIKQLDSKGVRLFGLTNAATESFEIMKKVAPILSLFEHTTVSSKISMIKPEPEIFEYCISENDLDRTKTLFVDDSKANCEAATLVGLNAHHFSNADMLYKSLIKNGVL